MAEIEYDKQEEQQIEAQEPQETISNKEKLMHSLVCDDDEVDELTVASLRQMLDAIPRWFLSQWKLLLLCLAAITVISRVLGGSRSYHLSGVIK